MTERVRNPLVERYASKTMASLFSEEFRYRTWRRLWVALAGAEHELGIRCDGQAARACGGVFDSQPLYADRVFSFLLCGNERQKCLFEGMTVVFEFGIPLSVTGPIGVEFPDGQRCGCPEDTAILVANVDCFGGSVRNRVVIPWR